MLAYHSDPAVALATDDEGTPRECEQCGECLSVREYEGGTCDYCESRPADNGPAAGADHPDAPTVNQRDAADPASTGEEALPRHGTLPRDITIGDKYRPAMSIAADSEAAEYFERLVEHTMGFGKSREAAEAIERANIGYFAGYYDAETRERVERLFGCAHPDALREEAP